MSLNRADLFRIIRNRIRITPGAQLDPAAVDKTGSTLNIFAAVASAGGEECESRSEARFAAQLVASASEGDLDRLILERSKSELPRLGAAAASIDLYLSRPNADAGEGTVEAGTEILAGGLTWTLDAAVIFAATAKGPFAATATCTTLGSAGNGVAADVQAFKTKGALFDLSLVVESVGTALDGICSSGGAERETDEAYRARYGLWDAGLDRNVDFLAAGALSVPGVVQATAIEDIDGDGNPVGTVTVFIGDAFGRATDGLLMRVRAKLREFRLLGQHVLIFRTVPEYQEIELSFGVLDTFDVAQVRDAARAAVVQYVNSLKPGSTLYPASLGVVLASVVGLVFLDSVPNGVVTPAAPVVPSLASTTYKTKPELVTFS